MEMQIRDKDDKCTLDTLAEGRAIILRGDNSMNETLMSNLIRGLICLLVQAVKDLRVISMNKA